MLKEKFYHWMLRLGRRNISKQQPKLPPQEPRKKEQNKPKLSRKKEMNIKAEINEIEYRKVEEKVSET